jgi:hypothetical protein
MRHRVERARNRDAQSHAPTSPVCPKRATVVPQPFQLRPPAARVSAARS